MLKSNSSVILKMANVVGPRSLLLSSNVHSAAAVPAEILNEESWATARPYKDVPGPTKWDLVKFFRPGGTLSNKNFADVQEELQKRYGNIVKLPGFLGKDDVVFVYEPEDMEKVYRTEGLYPKRRGLDSNTYYRAELRKDLFHKTSGLGVE